MRLIKVLALVLTFCLISSCALAAGMTLPEDTAVIEAQAFYGDASITSVQLPNGVQRIESEAFAHTGLTSVVLPPSLEYFASDAFDGCPQGFFAWVYPDSEALALCKSYQLPYQIKHSGRVGISMPASYERWITDGNTMRNQLQRYGYDVDLQFADRDPEVQAAQISAMIEDGCSVLVIAPESTEDLLPVLAQAKELGIPVISYDRLLRDTDGVSYYVNFGSQAVGAVQGNYIKNALHLDSASGPFYLEITAGDPQDDNALLFYEGAMRVLEPYIQSGKLIVKSGQANFNAASTRWWATDNAQHRAENILETYYSEGSRIDAWLCSNDSTALGVIYALEDHYGNERWPVITGQDCDLENVRLIVRDKQSMSVFKDTRILAAQAAKMVNQLLTGEDVDVNDDPVFNGEINVPTFLCSASYVDKSNYMEVLVDGGIYSLNDLFPVGISMPIKNGRWQRDGEAMRDQLRRFGYDVDLRYANGDPETQIEQLNAMMENGCTALVITPVSSDDLLPTLAQAEAMGIPVISYDRLLRNADGVSYYISFSNEAVGAVQGSYIRDALNLDNAAGPFYLEMTAGDSRDDNALLFFTGAFNVLAPYIDSGKLIVKSGQTEFNHVATEGWDTGNAQSRAKNILETYYADGSRIDAWLCANDSTASGVVYALKNSYGNERWPVITGQDCDLENVKMIIRGEQSMSVFKDSRQLAVHCANMIDQLLTGEEVDTNGVINNGKADIPTFFFGAGYVDINNYHQVLVESGIYSEESLR